MKATLNLNGKDYEVEISEEMAKDLEKPKKTGYERVKASDYYYVEYDGNVDPDMDMGSDSDNNCYEVANYYSDKTVAENNARADNLMRKLRRFAVEHRETKLDWNDGEQSKWFIIYDYIRDRMYSDNWHEFRFCGVPYFDTKDTAHKAIEEFNDELIWYFTEYKDSL